MKKTSVILLSVYSVAVAGLIVFTIINTAKINKAYSETSYAKLESSYNGLNEKYKNLNKNLEDFKSYVSETYKKVDTDTGYIEENDLYNYKNYKKIWHYVSDKECLFCNEDFNGDDSFRYIYDKNIEICSKCYGNIIKNHVK